MAVWQQAGFANQGVTGYNTFLTTKRAGTNTHHLIEATFKGLARTLRDAVRVDGGGVPSTKGTLSPPPRR